MDEDAKLNIDTHRTPVRPDLLSEADIRQLQFRLKQAEETLRVSEEKKTSIIRKLKKSRREFLSIFDSVPAMIWYRDREGKILRVNQCAADSVRKTTRELVGQNYYELFPDGAERARQQDLQVIQTGKPLQGQLRSFTVDGHLRWVSVDRIPLRNQDQAITGVMVFAVDVTEKKIAEDHLIQAKGKIEITNEQLQGAADRANQLADRETRSNLAKSEMLATSSHDLRTPMNAILGFADLLTDTDLDQEQAEYVKTINNSAKGLLTLLNDILDYAKLEAGKLNIEIVSCLLKEFVGEVRAMMETSVNQKGLDFIVQVDKRLPYTFFSDPLRLKQCLINLIGNAIKFTESGHIALYVTMEEHRGQKCIRIDVEDTGIGIAQNKLKTIFNTYSQADSSTARQYGGTGLGLSITKRLVELLGGHIRVASTLGKGSMFTMTLPLMTQESEEMHKVLPEPDQQRCEELSRDVRGRILLAEADVPSQLTLNLLLRRSGMEMKTVSTKKQIFEQLAQHQFDLILLDAQLDNGRGLEIVRNLRSSDIQIPIVAITTQDSDVIGEAISAGCNECLVKPVSRRTLHEVITIQLEEAAYERRRSQVRDSSVESGPKVAEAADEPEFMDVVEGKLDQNELLRLLPGLMLDLQQVLNESDVDQAQHILEVLSKVGNSCRNQQLTEKVDQIRRQLSQDPDAFNQIAKLVNDLDRLCGDIDRCCNRE